MSSRARQTPLVPPRQDARLVDVLRSLKRSIELGLSVSFVATVTKFDDTTQLLEVTPDFYDVIRTDDNVSVQDPFPFPNLLISFEGQGRVGGGYLSFPVSPGDKGYVTVSDRSLDLWIEDGKGRDPGLNHTHQRIDGIFKPIRDKTRAIPNFDQTAAVLEHMCIKLGANATEAAVLGDTMRAWADNLVSWAGTHTHLVPGVTVGMGSTTSNTPTNPPPSTTNFLSDKVKIDRGPPQ